MAGELTDDEQWVVGELLAHRWLPFEEIERRRLAAPAGRFLPVLAQALAPPQLDQLRRGLLARRSAPTTGSAPVATDEVERTVIMDLPAPTEPTPVAVATVALPPPAVSTLAGSSPAATLPVPRPTAPAAVDVAATLAAPPPPAAPGPGGNPWRPGLRLGDLVLGEKLGQGAMGAVFLGVKDGTEERFAVKVLPPAPPGSKEAERFKREGLAMSTADDHPNVARVHAHGEAHGSQYLVLELLEGGDLEKRIERQGPLPLLEALKVVVQLSRGLAHAHTRGVLHRDLKPANVMFDGAGRAKLADFGVARVAGQQSLTTTGALLGSPAFMSPEQAMGERRSIDERSDVYGLGAILYTAITGCLPHDGSSLPAVLTAVLNEPLQPPSRRRRGTAPDADALVLKAMAKEPDKRYQSARALTDALDALVAELEVAQGRRRRRALLIPLGLVGGLAVGGGGLAIGASLAGGGGVAPPASSAPAVPQTPTARTTTEPSRPAAPLAQGVPGTDPKGRRGPKALRADLVFVEEASRTRQFAYDYSPPGRPGLTFRVRWIPATPGVELGANHPYLRGEGVAPETRVVALKGFFLGETEVTRGQWAALRGAERPVEGGKFVDAQRTTCAPTADHPVTRLTWEEARALCADAGGRLPTEAEWEWAARGPDALHYPWGNEQQGQRIGERANIAGTAEGFTPVGSYPTGRSPFGCDDMCGNVAEWTADTFAPFALLRAASFHGPCFTDDDLRRIPESTYADAGIVAGARPILGVHVHRGGDMWDKADEGYGLARDARPGSFAGSGVRLALDEEPGR